MSESVGMFCARCDTETLHTFDGKAWRCEQGCAVSAESPSDGVRFVTLDQFVAVEEPGAAAILGSESGALIPERAVTR